MTDDGRLYRLIYVSRNALAGSAAVMEREVGHVLETSRRNNAHDGVTGALLFNRDCFAQLLEGSFPAVHRVFERIQLDTRHRDTVVLEAGPAVAREFGDWSMAFVGRVEGPEARYAALCGAGAAANASGRVLDLMRGVVLRAALA